MKAKLRVPCDLQPAACVVMGSGHVGRDQEALILTEQLRLPVSIDGVRRVHKAIGDRTASREEECSSFVLAVACFHS